MSVHDLEAHPWLTDEMTLLAAAIRAGHPVLGICLGAQLMAKALGAAVRPGLFREIGWFPVEGLPSRADGLTFPASFEAFHWHGDMVDLPPGAELLAQSPACPVQAFQIGTRAIGLQFHLETTPTSVRHLLQHCQADLIPGPYVQSPSDLLAAEPTRYSRLHLLLDQVMASLLRHPS